jgi:hypothetical protein
MKRLHILACLACVASYCNGEDKGTATGTHGGGAPDCLTYSQSTTGWTGDPGYQFEDSNFICQGTPTSEEFQVLESSFNSGAGLTGTLVSQNVGSVQSLWDAAGSGLNLTTTWCSLCGVSNDDESIIEMEAATAPIVGELGFALRHRDAADNMSCDITIYTNENNGTVINWTTSTTPSTNGHALRNALMHELGHCIGMEHPVNGSNLGTIMDGALPGAAGVVSLDNDDADAFGFLYP